MLSKLSNGRNCRHDFFSASSSHFAKLCSHCWVFTLCFDKVQWINLINLMVGEDELMIFVLWVAVCEHVSFTQQQWKIISVSIFFVYEIKCTSRFVRIFSLQMSILRVLVCLYAIGNAIAQHMLRISSNEFTAERERATEKEIMFGFIIKCARVGIIF